MTFPRHLLTYPARCALPTTAHVCLYPRADIAWWATFTTGCFVHSTPVPGDQFSIDACMDSDGGYRGKDRLYVHWQASCPKIASAHINIKELATVGIAHERWVRQWSNSHVVVYTDNTSTMFAINKGTSHSPAMMSVLHRLSTVRNFYLTARYLPGDGNAVSDCLSHPAYTGLLAADLHLFSPRLLRLWQRLVSGLAGPYTLQFFFLFAGSLRRDLANLQKEALAFKAAAYANDLHVKFARALSLGCACARLTPVVGSAFGLFACTTRSVHHGLLMLRNCFLDFAVEHWFGCRATEPGFTGVIGAIEVWLIDSFIHSLLVLTTSQCVPGHYYVVAVFSYSWPYQILLYIVFGGIWSFQY